MNPDHYDTFAESYADENASSLMNAYYERPAMIELAGDVAGRRVLDAGCGAGPLSAALIEQGAIVTGIDASASMPDLARRRLGTDADLRVVDLRRPVPFDDHAFDDVTASLVLHYLQDWSAPLAEMRRVLAPGGRLIISVNHPLVHKVTYPASDYFAITGYLEDFVFHGHTATLTFWHRPLHAMTDAFTAAGFRIAVVSEPPFLPETPRELIPDHLVGRTAFVGFIFFVLEAC